METKFTKGPWSYDDCGVVDSDAGFVCDVYVTDSDGYSNANLIAAAPEMYEALEQVMKTLSSDGFGCFDNTCAEIGKLLAKARGEHE